MRGARPDKGNAHATREALAIHGVVRRKRPPGRVSAAQGPFSQVVAGAGFEPTYRGPSRSKAKIAARTSPRPAFGPRGPGGPGGPGHQPPHGPPKPPPQWPFRPPKPRSHARPRQWPPDAAPMPRRTWPSNSPAHLNTPDRPESTSPAPQAAATIIRLPPLTIRSRYIDSVRLACGKVKLSRDETHGFPAGRGGPPTLAH